VAFGAPYIKQKLGFTEEEIAQQIRVNASMQYFLGYAGYVGPPE
jgi:IS5 family transposase